MKVNVGLERRKPGKRKAYEGKNVQGVPFDGDWRSAEAHAAFRQKVHEENPGWTVRGYALARVRP